MSEYEMEEQVVEQKQQRSKRTGTAASHTRAPDFNEKLDLLRQENEIAKTRLRDDGYFSPQAQTVDPSLLPMEGDPYGLPDKWALIKMHPKREEWETPDVSACVNGKVIKMQRGEWVPVNWAFVEVLLHAEHPKYSNEPGERRLKIGVVHRFPFHGPYEISRDDYDLFVAGLRLGYRITDAAIRKITGLSVGTH